VLGGSLIADAPLFLL